MDSWLLIYSSILLYKRQWHVGLWIIKTTQKLFDQFSDENYRQFS